MKITMLVGSILAATLLMAGPQAPSYAKKRITMAQARRIAVAAVPGKVQSGEFEKENGKQIYSFDLRAGDGVHEVNIDAHTGEILENKIENPADEAKEQQEDKAAARSTKKPSQH